MSYNLISLIAKQSEHFLFEILFDSRTVRSLLREKKQTE